MKTTRTKTPYISLALITTLFLTSGLTGQTKLKPGFNLFSLEQDVEIGRNSASEIEKQMPVLENERIQSYIERLGERLASATDGPDFPYQFKVVNVSDVNAFALPGGFMYVHRGLIEEADTEAELAGVVAHEISHVALRHGTNQASKAYLAQAGLGIASILLGGSGGSTTAQMIGAVGGFGLNATFLKFGRDAEKQADLMGAQILARAGYDPIAMSDFFEKLRELQGNDPSKMEIFFSSHPAPADRAQNVADETEMLNVRPRAPVEDFNAIKGSLGKMPEAPSMKDLAEGRSTPSSEGPPAKGESTADSNVRLETPSSRQVGFRSNSGLFSVNYPDNWSVSETPDGNGATILPRGGVTQVEGQNHVVYGMIFDRFDPSQVNYDGRSTSKGPFRGRSTLDRRGNLLIQRILENNGYLKAKAESARGVEIANGRGLVIDLIGASPATGTPELVTVVLRDLGDNTLFYGLFISPEKDRDILTDTFKRTLSSLKVTDQ